MINIGVIGIGNTGNQIAALAHKELVIPAVAINSSEKDLETLKEDIEKIHIKSTDETQGAGKDRKLAKEYLRTSISAMLQESTIIDKFIAPLDICFIVSSTGGGTGSGAAPMMANIISEVYASKKIILIGVLPVYNEALDSHVNTLEYLNELYNVLEGQTYMLYDNDKYSDLPSYQILEKVNEEIVADLNVMRCTFNYSTRYDSMDERDATRLLSFPGRIAIARLENFKEKDCDSKNIEELIIDTFKKNAHVELQRDKKLMAAGLITNLSPTLNATLNDNLTQVNEFFGEPVHAFKHIYVTEEREQPNNVFYIMAGLSAINDKINKINDRIADIEERQKIMEEKDALDKENLAKLSDKISDKTVIKSEDEKVSIANIINKFM